jgi:acetyltransferase-like isoleucine patch superfamily enzyme
MNGGRVFLSHDSLFRKSKITVKGKGSSVQIGNRCRFRYLSIVVCGKNSSVEIEDSVMVYEKCNISIIGDNCHCIIGKKTTIGSASLSVEESETNISIGEDCMISRGVRVNTTDKHSIIDLETGERINRPENIVVGNHVWLGHGVSLGKGSVVSDNSVVGEHAIVTKKFNQPNVCIVGIPAKMIKENINWTREKL